MIDALPSRRAVRSSRFTLAFTLLLAGPAFAGADDGQSLARFIPADGLAALVEHDGLAGHAEAWRASAAYKMLNETSLGAMVEDIAVQLGRSSRPVGTRGPDSGQGDR